MQHKVKSNCSKIAYIFLFTFIFNIYTLKGETLQSQIAKVSLAIIDNKVQLKLIDDYITGLSKTYEKKVNSLNKKYKEFAVSVSILYKLSNNPKELLLIDNYSKEHILTTYVIINHWLKNATRTINKTYLEISALKHITKELNDSKHKLQALNQQLNRNQKTLNKLLAQKNESTPSLESLHDTRALLKYNTLIHTQTEKLFARIDKPILTKEDKARDNSFIEENKGNMVWPTKGYIYNTFQNIDYYNLTYYGISVLSQPNTSIVTPAAGEIIFCDTLEKYNNVIMIKHSPSYISIISGQFTPLVKLSQKVHKDEVLGKLGNNSTIIYYELNQQSSPIDPIEWLTPQNN